jgi:hypothetical protein
MFHAIVPRVFSLLTRPDAKVFRFKLPSAEIVCVFLPTTLCPASLRSEKLSDCASQFQRIAPKLCKPYHRVEFCGVNPGATAAFHKVINIHVQNFIAQK